MQLDSVRGTFLNTGPGCGHIARPNGCGVSDPLCIASGRCAGLTPRQIIQKDRQRRRRIQQCEEELGDGFQGDPFRPISGKYDGYLIWTGLY